jgi:hypothetical protein
MRGVDVLSAMFRNCFIRNYFMEEIAPLCLNPQNQTIKSPRVKKVPLHQRALMWCTIRHGAVARTKIHSLQNLPQRLAKQAGDCHGFRVRCCSNWA